MMPENKTTGRSTFNTKSLNPNRAGLFEILRVVVGGFGVLASGTTVTYMALPRQ